MTLWKPTDEKDIAEAVAKTGRRCGQCSLCCRLLDVQELKPRGQWCPHCRPGHGCSIYHDRPRVCRNYACAWLIDRELGDEWYPAYSRIIVDTARYPADDNMPETAAMRFHVCPHSPDRWREEPYYSTIKAVSLRGLQGHNGAHWFTIVTVGHHQRGILVLPHREVEWGPGVVVPLGPDRYEYVRKRDAAMTLELNDLLANLQSLVVQAREKNPQLTTLECFDAAARVLSE